MHHDYTKPLPPLPTWARGRPSKCNDHTFAYPLLEQGTGVIVQLFATDIIFWTQRTLMLHAGGWHTPSTQAWLNEALRGVGGEHVSVANPSLSVHTPRQWMVIRQWQPLQVVSEWYDGITFDHVTGRLITKAVQPTMKVLNQERWRVMRAVLREMRALYEPFYALHLGQTNDQAHQDMRLPEVAELNLTNYHVYAMAKAMLAGKPCPLKGTYHEYLSLFWFNGYRFRHADVAEGWRRTWDRIASTALSQDPDAYLCRSKYPIGLSD